jgi:hypothetical protein
MKKQVIDFNRLPKQEYMKPSMKVIELKQKYQILAGSVDANGMNTSLQDEDDGVDKAW